MTQEWVPYGQGSAVQESIALAGALDKQGVSIKPLHQGYEETEPGDDNPVLQEMRQFGSEMSGKYNPATGHAEATRNFGHFARDFLGLPDDHVFTVQTNGRVGLGHAFKRLAALYPSTDLHKLVALVPKSCWPMVADEAQDERITNYAEYDVRRGQIADSVIEALDNDRGTDRIAVLYSNFPHNPTGLFASRKEIAAIQSRLDDINADRQKRGQPPIVHVCDDPYFMGLPQNDTAPFIDSPYAGQFQVGGPTPSIHLISLSKALATARPGFHGAVYTNSDMADAHKKFLTRNVGVSFVPEFMHAVASMLDPDNADHLKAHFTKIHEKYTRNNAIFDKTVPTAVDGDPGMTRVLSVPDTALSKRVDFHGTDIDVRTTRDVCAYIANTSGTIVVAQAEGGEENLIRVALKSENPEMIEKGCKDIANALKELENAAPIPAAA